MKTYVYKTVGDVKIEADVYPIAQDKPGGHPVVIHLHGGALIGGSRKMILYDDLEPSEKLKLYDSGISVCEDDLEGRRAMLVNYRVGDVWSPHVSQAEPLRTMAEHFVECIRKGKSPETDGQAGLRVVRILEAAQRSIKAQGGRITL